MGLRKSIQKLTAMFLFLGGSTPEFLNSDSTNVVRLLAKLLINRKACKTIEGSESRRLESINFFTFEMNLQMKEMFSLTISPLTLASGRSEVERQ